MPGALEIKATARRLPVTVSGLSTEGAGLSLDDAARVLIARGAEVSISFDVHGFPMELPARVVWYRPAHGEPGRLGARLELDGADGAVRRSYLAWVKHAVFEARRDVLHRPPAGRDN